MWRLILVPHDFSRCAARALEQAELVARTMNARLALLHVSQLPPNLPPGTRVTAPGETTSLPIAEHLTHGAERDLAKVMGPLRAAGLAVEGTVRMSREDLATEILAVAEEISADAIVLGTHGRRGLSRLLLGSVAENVVRHSRVPVLTVRSHDDDLPKTREEAMAEDELAG